MCWNGEPEARAFKNENLKKDFLFDVHRLDCIGPNCFLCVHVSKWLARVNFDAVQTLNEISVEHSTCVGECDHEFYEFELICYTNFVMV